MEIPDLQKRRRGVIVWTPSADDKIRGFSCQKSHAGIHDAIRSTDTISPCFSCVSNNTGNGLLKKVFYLLETAEISMKLAAQLPTTVGSELCRTALKFSGVPCSGHLLPWVSYPEADGKAADGEAASLDGKHRFTFLQEVAGEVASLVGKRRNQ
ncbi:hypothetical protein E2562_018177 [Oryza meyeriana var. granulata]|uniref:Uncharacterized protein n=1 Tax=Oryza meyeriana var. granulata TaxID=110450 RepID=A0A6G1C7D4_9ORYZ|nr:hypothetical protein E2562_018177 [Oryza meyeriana var. granulata]